MLYLKKREEKRLRAGHLWVYSNEIDTNRSPLKSFTPGQCVTVCSHEGKPLGSAYVNPHSLIAARLFDERKDVSLDQAFFEQRLQDALTLRELVFDKPYYRLCFSEGDYLPGLIIDRYDDCFVLQINTAGMQAAQEPLVAAIESLFNPAQIVLRNDSGSRALEGLEKVVQVIKGDENEPVYVEENGARFQVDVVNGQKTGWFYDQRINRKNTQQWVKDKTVLDVFSYTGSWAISTAMAGASQVTAIDASASALDVLKNNAETNQVGGVIDTICQDAFVAMQALKDAEKSFDIVLIDPPAFIKRKKDLQEGLQAYIRANRMAMSLVKPGGLLISSSCSYHMSQVSLQNSLLKASRKIQRKLQILGYGYQGPDHPIHPAIEETSYLKTIFSRVL